MKLPNRFAIEVSQRKIEGYLLSSSHPAGRSKAAFFRRCGFSRSDWTTLATALRRHADEHEVAKAEATSFGVRYIIDGPLSSPDGRLPLVRSVWFIEQDEPIPRFVTAYPLRRARSVA